MSIAVFHNPKMIADVKSVSPSAGKPTAVIQRWFEDHKFDLSLRKSEAVLPDGILSEVHDPAYVKGILDGSISTGFDVADAAVGQSCLYTVGAMMTAARHVCESDTHDGAQFAVAPVSGFHHAQYKQAAGFCTFNGLVVAALDIVQRGGRAGILDCDQHYGDGTDALLDRLRANGQLKPHDVMHWTQGALYGRHPYSMKTEEDYWDALTREAQKMFTMCDVVLYQAGADPHKDDPYGGWMTNDDLRLRDAIVFSTCARLRGRCAWNLAGGYQRDADGGITPVLNIHAATMEECLRASNIEESLV